MDGLVKRQGGRGRRDLCASDPAALDQRSRRLTRAGWPSRWDRVSKLLGWSNRFRVRAAESLAGDDKAVQSDALSEVPVASTVVSVDMFLTQTRSPGR
jgi:hypothetical protein